jgi:hypothetical protein
MAEGENSPKIDPAEIEVLIDRVKQNKLNQREAELIAGLLRTLLYLLGQLQDKTATIRRLQEMIFGRKSEKRKKGESKSPEGQAKPDQSGEADNGGARNQTENDAGAEASEKKEPKKRGHGRIPASAYPGAKKVYCRHPELSSGSQCPTPDCQGKVYRLFRPHQFIQFTGAPVINATHYSQETLKCKVCDRVYEAPLPEGIKPQKFDESADVGIVIDHYLAATPAYRRSGLQELSGIPLPISTIHERCAAVAETILPIYKEMEKAAANAKILYGDDTWVRIQELKKENKGKKKGERVGMYTTGIVAERVDSVKIALYLNSRRHTGENVDRLLEKREKDQPKVIRMGDAARVNWSTQQESEDCACLAHARRKFAELEKTHPRSCSHALDEIGKIYEHEAVARQMSDEDRLAYHEKLSLPILSKLRQWISEEIEDKRVEPNSGLGKAMAYFENQYEMLVQFCRIPGAPIDNNTVERALKAPVMIRKNSYGYKTSNGAGIGGIILSVLITCRLNRKNIWNYLTWVLRNADEVKEDPGSFLPWLYEEGGEEKEQGRAA